LDGLTKDLFSLSPFKILHKSYTGWQSVGQEKESSFGALPSLH